MSCEKVFDVGGHTFVELRHHLESQLASGSLETLKSIVPTLVLTASALGTRLV